MVASCEEELGWLLTRKDAASLTLEARVRVGVRAARLCVRELLGRGSGRVGGWACAEAWCRILCWVQ